MIWRVFNSPGSLRGKLLLTNLEALTNICTNGAQILGFIAGGALLVSSFIPFASGLRGYSKKILIVALVMIALGVSVTLIVNVLLTVHQPGRFDLALAASLAVAAIIGLIEIALSIAGYFLPTIIADRQNKKNKLMILICNIVSFIPLVWLIAFIWACIPEKPAMEALLSESTPPEE